jgi:hypothetical protein
LLIPRLLFNRSIIPVSRGRRKIVGIIVGHVDIIGLFLSSYYDIIRVHSTNQIGALEPPGLQLHTGDTKMITATAIDFSEYAYYGLRSDDRSFVIGEDVPCSFTWIDGTKTDEELDGTCATKIEGDDIEKAINFHVREGYVGKKYVIAGDYMTYGEDSGEIIIRDAIVIAIC